MKKISKNLLQLNFNGGYEKSVSLSQNRQTDIDIFRSFGIILMVMGHIGFGEIFDYFIHAFHMPMFFFVSGMFFNTICKLSIQSFVIRKSRTILRPYLFFGLLHLIAWEIFNYREMSFEPLSHLIWENTEGLPIAGALWFLTAFFFSEIIYYLLRKYIRKKLGVNALVAVISILGCLCTSLLPFRLPWALDAAFVGVGLIHIGNLFKNDKRLRRLLSLRPLILFFLCAVTLVMIFMNGYINMRTGNYAFIPLFWLNVVLSVIVGINLSKLFVLYAPEKIVLFLSSIGKNSIVYLCLNQITIMVLNKMIGFLNLPTIASKLAILLSTVISLYICEKIIMSSRLRVIVGKG